MRIGVLSDIHGNPHACNAVLQAIAQAGPFDQVIAAGDLCFGGSDPAACVDQLRTADVQAIYGNTDEFIFAVERKPSDALHRSQWESIKPAALWAREKLGPERVGWLGQLPFDVRFSPSGAAGDDLLVVHANPKDAELAILPAPADQQALWGEIRQPDDDPDLQAAFEGITAAVVAFGHFHYTCERPWHGLRLVNVAPCSLPATDGDPRARFTAFSWNEQEIRWDVERHWVPYDFDQELYALQESGMPNWTAYARSFPDLDDD